MPRMHRQRREEQLSKACREENRQGNSCNSMPRRGSPQKAGQTGPKKADRPQEGAHAGLAPWDQAPLQSSTSLSQSPLQLSLDQGIIAVHTKPSTIAGDNVSYLYEKSIEHCMGILIKSDTKRKKESFA